MCRIAKCWVEGGIVADPVKSEIQQKTTRPAQLYSWFNQRTGIRSLMHSSLDEPVPGGARLAYVFGSGLIYIFISQVITGLCLALYYVPSAESAHTSVAYITKSVAAGQFLRSLHYYGSSAMIVVLALHFLQTFIYGSFKGRRELLWIAGAVLSVLVLCMGFTGYLLPWDQSAYFATAVGTNIIGVVPLIGHWLNSMVRGGDTLGTLTLSRFYFAHVFLIPGMIFLFIGLHIAFFRKAGPAGPINEDPINPKLPPESFYPRQVLMDMTFALLLMVALGFFAYFHPEQLGPVADPSNTKFIPRPEWYYLPMFEWLKFWSGRLEVFAVVVIPGILALAFFLLPFLDRSLERRPWRRPIPLLAVSAIMVGIIFLGFKSHLDDMHDQSVAKQLAFQDQQDRDYTKSPFHARMESASGVPIAGPVSPLVGQGKGVFTSQGCSSCHGNSGLGTAAGPSLVGITAKYPIPQLDDLLQHPNAQMTAGHMPVFHLPNEDMKALFSYLASLSTAGGAAAPTAAAGPTATAALTATAAPTATASSSTPPAETTSKAPAPAAKDASTKSKSGPGSTASATEPGEQIFKQGACAACHGVAGAGGRVPAIAPLIAKRSDAQLLAVLKKPNAKMKAGGMQPVAVSPAELSSLVKYLRTLGGASQTKQALSTSTPAPSAPRNPTQNTGSAPAKDSSAAVAAASPPKPVPEASAKAVSATKPNTGHAVFVSQGCAACHGANAGGTHFAPALTGVSAKFPGNALPTLLHHPNAKMKAGGMPPVTANPGEMKQLISYLTTLDAAPAPAQPSAPTTNVAKSGATAPPGTADSTPIHAIPTTPPSRLAIAGGKIFEHYSCQTCHGIGGLNGTAAAPALAGTASGLPAATLHNLLRHHSIQMKKGDMPATTMNENDLTAVIAYIRAMPAVPATQ
jgi:ubiquinol-cytochrome c reductase cytochrome b subunit